MSSVREGSLSIWELDLDLESDLAVRELQTLSSEERERASRYRFDADRRVYLKTRYMLRELLGSTLACLPQAIEFSYSAYGRPMLAGVSNAELDFNVSHSGERALIAISERGAVGIDIERIGADKGILDLCQNFFHPEETQRVLSEHADGRLSRFYEIWTLKEAVIKLLGTGLSQPLTEFCVPHKASCPTMTLGEKQFSAWPLQVGDGYAAAFASEGDGVYSVQRHLNL